jgi:cytosine deaminase
MFDLIVRGGALPDGRVVDIGIKGDRITAIDQLASAEAGEVIDATGDLVSPPFVDPHFHMDATLSYGLVLSRFSSGLFRAMFAMKERTNGKEIHR